MCRVNRQYVRETRVFTEIKAGMNAQADRMAGSRTWSPQKVRCSVKLEPGMVEGGL
jgi:hypothetical protein